MQQRPTHLTKGDYVRGDYLHWLALSLVPPCKSPQASEWGREGGYANLFFLFPPSTSTTLLPHQNHILFSSLAFPKNLRLKVQIAPHHPWAYLPSLSERPVMCFSPDLPTGLLDGSPSIALPSRKIISSVHRCFLNLQIS